jgi:hypothetical protein
MKFLRKIQGRIRFKEYGVDLASEINAVVSANVGGRPQQRDRERKEDESSQRCERQRR